MSTRGVRPEQHAQPAGPGPACLPACVFVAHLHHRSACLPRRRGTVDLLEGWRGAGQLQHQRLAEVGNGQWPGVLGPAELESGHTPPGPGAGCCCLLLLAGNSRAGGDEPRVLPPVDGLGGHQGPAVQAEGREEGGGQRQRGAPIRGAHAAHGGGGRGREHGVMASHHGRHACHPIQRREKPGPRC